MKTTVEINGYFIDIEEKDGVITVAATKDEEVVEEFSIEIEEGQEEEGQEEEAQSFDKFDEEEEEEDFEDDEEGQDDEEEEAKLESFQSFINKKK
jgi:hypothetical protein